MSTQHQRMMNLPGVTNMTAGLEKIFSFSNYLTSVRKGLLNEMVKKDAFPEAEELLKIQLELDLALFEAQTKLAKLAKPTLRLVKS